MDDANAERQPHPDTLRIEGTMRGETREKRFYLPGVVVRDACPACGAQYERDYGHGYLSYPTAGEPFDLKLYCGECEHEWERRVRLDIALVAVTP